MSFKIYSQKILKKSANLPIELKDFFTSKLMFPTLKEMCTQLDPKLGFNVEIKYPIDLEVIKVNRNQALFKILISNIIFNKGWFP